MLTMVPVQRILMAGGGGLCQWCCLVGEPSSSEPQNCYSQSMCLSTELLPLQVKKVSPALRTLVQEN